MPSPFNILFVLCYYWLKINFNNKIIIFSEITVPQLIGTDKLISADPQTNQINNKNQASILALSR